MTKRGNTPTSADLPLKKERPSKEKPLSSAYTVLDNDLARDNLENNIPAADLQDL